MVGRDTPEPIRSGRPCKTSHGAGCGQRTENPPALAVGSVNKEWIIALIHEMAAAGYNELELDFSNNEGFASRWTIWMSPL
ncbi:MAG: hypothetical protein ACLSAF_13435 [Intestinimonas sp.]